MFNVVLTDFDQIQMNDVVVFPDANFLLKWNFAFPGTKFIRNISRSKPRLFDTSIHSLMTHSRKQPHGEESF